MKIQKPKKPFIPMERRETIRQKIISLLADRTVSAKDLSAEVLVSEKEIYEHLEHIHRSVGKGLTVMPAECRKCGFVFKKRDKMKKPGRCPVCHSELIQEPFFTVSKT
jgi:predicted Zn-ribbon and HTH transcriptional regulator